LKANKTFAVVQSLHKLRSLASQMNVVEVKMFEIVEAVKIESERAAFVAFWAAIRIEY
jgi:hypothetical protein